MTLKTFVKKLNKLAEEYPNLKVVTAMDDEGNGFNVVSYSPSIGFFDPKMGRNSFTPIELVKDYPNEEEYDKFRNKKPNAICVN